MKDHNHKDCPICDEELFSDVGKGCKMCGIPLEDKTREFCSRKCETDYRLIHHNLTKHIMGVSQ